MSDSEKKSASPPTANANEMEKLNKELVEIEVSLQKIDQSRKKQLFTTLLGIVAVLLVIAFFIVNLINFVRSYDSQMLLKEISNNSSIITDSPELAAVAKDFRTIFIPAYKRELTAALKDEMPKIKKRMMASSTELGTYIKVDVSKHIQERLTKALQQIEAKIIAEHPKISATELHNAFTEVNRHFVTEVTTMLEKRLKLANERLAELKKTLDTYRQTPEYKILNGEENQVAENKLLETFLELWIYHLNPAKGEQLANGGK